MTALRYGGWRPYVAVADRRRQAADTISKLRKSGREARPVRVIGRKIATTFWGESWCKNLEAYSDYENRLPRGRTYVRNGSVIDLQIETGKVSALVSGSDIYQVEIDIQRLRAKKWKTIRSRCSGQIDSIVELLKGSISRGVMEVVTRKGEGLFPSPREIELSCSCPDWATMCKHVAAALYGVGSRLDEEPSLLFALRGVDPAELIEAAVEAAPGRRPSAGKRVLADEDVASVFGIEIDMGEDAVPRAPGKAVKKTVKKAAKKTAKKKVAKKAAKKAAKKTASPAKAERERIAAKMKAYWLARRRSKG